MPDTTVQVKDLYLSNDAVKKLITLIIDYVNETLPVTTSVLPMTSDEANAAENKDKIPTALAVFNALAQIDHIKFRLYKGDTGQSFSEYMADKTPEELALYFYRTADTPNFDLWLYDSTQGEYVRVGHDSVGAGDIDLADYWKKSELDINAYWSKEELRLDDITGAVDLSAYARTEDLAAYWKKEDLEAMTEAKVEEIFNEVKNASVTPGE